jgi:CHAD domain-containing protein
MSWIGETIASEAKALERARKRFIDEPTPEGLHQVRTGARRLRSLLEDVAAMHPQKRLLQRVKRASQLTDVARDAGVQRELLERMVDDGERELAEPMLATLREREERATDSSRRKLRRIAFKTKRNG